VSKQRKFQRERREQTPHQTQRERKKRWASKGSFSVRGESKHRIKHKEKERNCEQATESNIRKTSSHGSSRRGHCVTWESPEDHMRFEDTDEIVGEDQAAEAAEATSNTVNTVLESKDLESSDSNPERTPAAGFREDKSVIARKPPNSTKDIKRRHAKKHSRTHGRSRSVNAKARISKINTTRETNKQIHSHACTHPGCTRATLIQAIGRVSCYETRRSWRVKINLERIIARKLL
jgi:hypothetical protein